MNTKNSLTLTKRYKLILSVVHMVYRLVNSTYNVEELILRLTRLVCQFVKADSSVIYILDQNTKKIILKAVFNNQINILFNKRKDLKRIPKKEMRVAKGYAIFEPHTIGLPLVADDNIGAIFIKRNGFEPAFSEYDKEILSVVAEQSVTAIKNIQLYEKQQNTILSSMKFIQELLKRYGSSVNVTHATVYFKIIKSLCRKLSMSQDQIDNLYYASILRDAGAIDVPYDILSKNSQLTPEEFKIIQEQPTRSVELIRPVEFLKPVLPIVLYHHEKYDGSGYPSGLKKEQIPLGARVMALVDAFEAMVRERPYTKKKTVNEAIEELKENSGTQFDPKVVNAFVQLSRQKNFRKYLSSCST